jgi:triphosphatase
MALETELKLLINERDAVALAKLNCLKGSEFVGTQTLLNVYFDTLDLQLTQHKVALRIRKQGNRWIQTVKTRGKSVNGLHQRGEWEWDLPENALDFSKLNEAQWPEALKPEALADEIMPIFTTDFERSTWNVQKGDALIELVLDQGEVSYEDKHSTENVYKDPILELELELKKGSVEALLDLKSQLMQELSSLSPSDVSKAERGYRLFDQAQATRG